MAAKRYTDKHHEEVVRLYVDKEWSIAEISRKRGLPSDPKTIRRWLKQKRIKLRGPQTARVFPRKKILRELERGTPRRQIQEKYGCSAKFLSLLARGFIEP